MRQKACKVCRDKFDPRSSLQQVCSPPCAIDLAKEKREKAYKAETKRRREKLKTRSDYMREAQKAFNGFIRARDAGKPCISCGRDSGAKINAGHYKAVGSHPELRFNEFNCHLQCEHCNTYLSGNLIDYRINLIERIGQSLVDWLEGPHAALKPTVDELKFLKKHYTDKTKALRAAE